MASAGVRMANRSLRVILFAVLALSVIPADRVWAQSTQQDRESQAQRQQQPQQQQQPPQQQQQQNSQPPDQTSDNPTQEGQEPQTFPKRVNHNQPPLTVRRKRAQRERGAELLREKANQDQATIGSFPLSPQIDDREPSE